jgi:predicted metalloprotease with PDZ domain
MSTEVYSPEILAEFINFYNRGAVTAALLDIRLLELSGGTYGLRDLFLELLNKYGKYRPFPEEKLFDVIVEMTYPEIRKFIDDYIRDSKQLPYEEYFYKLGYKYIAQRPSEDKRPSVGMNIGVQDGEIYVFDVRNENGEEGLKIGDVLLKIMGQDVTLGSIRELLGEVYLLDIGDSINVLVRRDGQEVEVAVKLKQRISRHVFEEINNLNDSQILLRNAWIKNL